jgi:hypothetical protein
MGDRRPANFCLDCGKPISSTAFRCQRCAMRSRSNMTPVPARPPDAAGLRRWDTLTADEIQQIRDADSDLQAAILAHRLNVDPVVLRTIRGGHIDTDPPQSIQLSR